VITTGLISRSSLRSFVRSFVRFVEVAGIEPASFSLSPSILRAQSMIFLGHRLVIDAGRRLKPTKFPLSPAGAATR
jgi:hypothetical protein